MSEISQAHASRGGVPPSSRVEELQRHLKGESRMKISREKVAFCRQKQENCLKEVIEEEKGSRNSRTGQGTIRNCPVNPETKELYNRKKEPRLEEGREGGKN